MYKCGETVAHATISLCWVNRTLQLGNAHKQHGELYLNLFIQAEQSLVFGCDEFAPVEKAPVGTLFCTVCANEEFPAEFKAFLSNANLLSEGVVFFAVYTIIRRVLLRIICAPVRSSLSVSLDVILCG